MNKTLFWVSVALLMVILAVSAIWGLSAPEEFRAFLIGN